MTAQNEPNFALFTSSDLDFLTDELFTEKELLKELFTESNKRHFNGFACVVYVFRARIMQYDARWISNILENGGMVE